MKKKKKYDGREEKREGERCGEEVAVDSEEGMEEFCSE